MFKITRRQFIHRTSLLTAATVIAAGCSDGSDSFSGSPVNAVVIGTGFAGSVAALRLGQAGIATTVLERGMQWPTEGENVFPGLNIGDRRAVWSIPSASATAPPARAPYAGLVETIPGTPISAQCGACVGGGSLVYGGVLIPSRREAFNSVFPRISFDDMENIYYPRVIQQFGASPIPDDVLASPTYRSHRAFIDDALAAGNQVIRPNTSFDWDIIRQEIAGIIPPAASIGEYAFGCNSHAKLSTDKHYLRDAIATGNVELRSLTEVEMIRETPQGYTVTCRNITPEGELIERYELHATHLFLAAGSMNTTKLLLKSQAAGELKAANDRIGQGWGTNGDQLLAHSRAEPIPGVQGGPACVAFIDDRNPDYPVTSMHSPAPLGMQLQMFMSVPDVLGQLTYNAGRDAVDIFWPPDAGTPSEVARRASLQRMVAASGGAELPLAGFIANTIWHPLGGALMGDACDDLGQVYGYKNLFVVDGALLPGSAATVNPALTIAANAERIMETLVKTL
jgi:cholesterol oxidase